MYTANTDFISVYPLDQGLNYVYLKGWSMMKLKATSNGYLYLCPN